MRLFTLGLLLLLGWTVNAQIVENIDSPNWGLDEYDGVEMREINFTSPVKFASGKKSASGNRYFTNVDGTYNAVATGNDLVVILPNGDQLTGLVGKPLTRTTMMDWPWELECSVLEPSKTDVPQAPDARHKSSSGCLDIFTEVEYNLYQALGDGTADYIDAVLFQVAQLAAQDQIFFNWSEVFIWDTEDPFTGETTSQQLQQFSLDRQPGTYNGQIAQLLGDADAPNAPRGGIAWLNVLCRSSVRTSFSSIRTVYNNIPVYSWTIMVIAHEIGHNIGSRHTHDCVWNGDNTAIDICGGDFCGGGVVPQDGGTIMSYCHANPVGVNFNLGYGPQPSQLMRDKIANASCVICASDPEPEPECDGTEVIVEVTFDGRPEDITFAFENGEFWIDFEREWAGKTFVDTVCLVDGCYKFVIGDSYGDGLDDGLCAAGSYRVFTAQQELVQYRPFDDVSIHEFCLGQVPECDYLDLSKARPYGTNQHAGDIFIDERTEGVLVLKDNAWAAVDVEPFTVNGNEDLILSFWFKGEERGEIGGIGVDNNEVINSNLSFNLYGSQGWGFRDITYDTPGIWKYYEIPLSDYISGTFDRITFIADEDYLPSCEYHYYQVALTRVGCEDVKLTPPDVTVPKSLSVETSDDFRVFDMLGRLVTPSANLPKGMYVVKRGSESKIVFHDGRRNSLLTVSRNSSGKP
jgi:hypothetical protein